MHSDSIEFREGTLKAAFVAALQLPATVPSSELVYGITEGWDSVAHMALIAEIEGAFRVMLSTDDVIDMSSFEKAREILLAKGIIFL